MTAASDTLRLALEPPQNSGHHGQHQKPLSDRLRRLWTERGDFSKFSLTDLQPEETAISSEDDSKEVKTSNTASRVQISWGRDGEEGLNHLKRSQGAYDADKTAQAPQDIDTSPMTVEELVVLKEEMMHKLQYV